jgi:hypothetical protein
MRLSDRISGRGWGEPDLSCLYDTAVRDRGRIV